ncbi:hypothetical protein [Dokdonia sp.]|uniref:hypothetical protein n=1 Tax=Dokdonia sp. TaxID=2024995 RepID=UPI003267BA32
MNLKIVILFYLILNIVGCKQHSDKNGTVTNSEMEIIQSQKTSSYITDWVNAINDNSIPNIEKMYASNAIKVIPSDSILNSSKSIAAYYGIQKTKIISVESLFNVEANKNRRITYELIRYKTEDLKEYMQLLIWRFEDQKVIREFEFTEEISSESKKVGTSDITKRRKLWMELCNENNAEKLVQELYSSNTIYFNHKPIIKGVENVIKEYAYMNNANYSLNLQPLTLEVVNANLVYEIGQCSGSYNGKYILVWKKESNGIWNIYIDSNI